MNTDNLYALRLHQRRTFLTNSCRGVGALALVIAPRAAALGRSSREGRHRRSRTLPPKAKRVIFMVMAGGASHLELFDNKPELAKRNGQPMPECVTKGQPIAQLQGDKLTCFGPQWGFKKHGKSGQEMNELFKFLPEVADDLCIVRSCKTEAINHDPAHTFMNTGSSISGRPSMGSWLTYGLGSEADDLPGLRRAHVQRPRRAEPADRVAAVGGRVPAGQVPGRAASRQGRPGAVPHQPAGRRPRPAEGRDRRRREAEPDAERRGGRPRNRHPHRAVRARVQDADQRAGADGPEGRTGEGAGDATARRAATARSRRTACSPAGWPRRACGSSSSTTATGTTTAASRTASS